jgi:type IV pilus assembly protein PilQ
MPDREERDEMRLKQLSRVVLPVLALSAMAAADSRITDISVQSKANASTVSIHANGAFTHNEYRPADNLLLVDFPGAGVGTMDSRAHEVSIPGVSSYQVHSYKAANGSEIARVELTLAPRAGVRFREEKNALLVLVTAPADASPASAAVSMQPVKTSAAAAPAAAVPSKPAAAIASATSAALVHVHGVSAVRGHDGLNVEIRASGPLTPKVLKLTHPDRLVIDLTNALPDSRPHTVPVHSSDVDSIRMARFQANPPTTRVVVDLKMPQDYELASTATVLTVKLHPVGATLKSAPMNVAPKTPVQTAISVPAVVAPVPSPTTVAGVTPVKGEVKPAHDVVVVEPQYHIALDNKTPAVKTASERAAEAAQTLGATPPVEIPLTSGTNAAMKPELVKAAMTQQGAQQLAAPAPAQSNSTQAPGPTSCNTGRYTGEPISVNLKDVDLKDFFRLIHEISGLNVVLDPGVTGNLTIVLDDVPWDQALAIVLQNNGLQCQLSGNVLRIALPDTLRKEADAVRTTLEAQALAVDRVTVTRYLSYASAKGVVPTLKAFLSKRGDIIADDRTNAVIIQDIPSVIPGIDRLIHELDRKTPQVEIEARVVAATRNFARDLGTQLGFGFGNNATAIGGASATGASPVQVTVPGSSTAPPVPYITIGTGQIPLFSNLPAGPGPTTGLTFLNRGRSYRVDMILTAAESRGLLKILSRPRITTQNNQQAVIRQGVRIPVVTAAQLGGPPTTTYVEAFLRLQVTPQITADGTIFLNADVENTTPDFGQQVQGNPTLITQQATTQVLVADGGTVVIGGVIQSNDNITYQQVPVLGNIPVLGNLFKRKSVSTSTQELIFFITPRIIQT